MKLPSVWTIILTTGAALLATLRVAVATDSTPTWPGVQADGSMLLPNQWSLRPAGTFVQLGDFPVNMALTRDGKFAAVLHAGYGQHEVVIVDLAAQKIVDRARLVETFYGIAFSHDGKELFCSGASGELVYMFRFDKGRLSRRKNIHLRSVQEMSVPAGLAIDDSGKTLFVADLWSSRVSRVTLKDSSVEDVVLESNAPPLLTMAPKAKEDFDAFAARKRTRAILLAAGNVMDGAFPYACVLDPGRGCLYVSLWDRASVAVVDLHLMKVIAYWPVGEHPSEMALTRNGKTLFVANANDNTVSVLDTRTGHATETLWATLFPDSPRGATPDSLTLSPDEKMLFIANANINAIAVFDISEPAHGRSLGFIPTGWYPTSVRMTPDGRRLLVANGKGNIAVANPKGPQPQPGHKKKNARAQYIANLFPGTLSIIEMPSPSGFTQQMAAWTAEVLKCTPLRPDASVVRVRPEGNPIPDKVGESSPITHCIYVIKENRTYDQVFGDVSEGNGDPKLCLFPQAVTPNLHKLVHEFVLLDNFYADAEVSADGHEWSMGAYASDFVEKTWRLNYGHPKTKFPYPSEGVFPIASPASGYLWDCAQRAGVSYRSYGEFVQNPAQPGHPSTTKLKALKGHFDPWFRSFDLDYPDARRAERFISELKRFEREGEMPRLQIVRLPNDHTYGVTKGAGTPTAFVAENDAAVGRLVEAVTHSTFWTNTAIFIVEDDAQDGPDHVDAHRTEALVISPYTRRGAVDSTLYSTTSMLRTMELILGVAPMTQFDAAATPMFNSFQAQADTTPYFALPPEVNLNARNTAQAWGTSEKFNFVKEDANDDIKFNEVIWRSVRGSDNPMPAPVHAGFVRSVRGAEDDDD
jgi:YVTN family beta-propeller protein